MKNNAEKDKLKLSGSATYDISLNELGRIIWKSRVLIILITFLFAICAIIYVINTPNIYRADVQLSPSSTQGGNGNISNNFGGLASLAGISLGSSGSNKLQTGLEVLKSRRFFENLALNNNLLPALYAAINWDPVKKEIIYDAEIYDYNAKTWVGEHSSSRSLTLALYKAHQKFLSQIVIDVSDETGFVRISYEHYSPYFAKYILETVVKELNNVLREQDIKKAENSISYLRKELDNTMVKELQTGLFDLIQSQVETIMLANASPEYIFEIIDPAVAPLYKSKPRRAMITIISSFLGFVVALFIVLFRQSLKKHRRNLE